MTKADEPAVVFQGSGCDGPEVNLIDWSGVVLTEEEADRFYELSEMDLIESCPSAILETDEVIEDGGPPGYNDEYYTVRSWDPEKLKAEMARVILEGVGRELQ